MGNKSISQSLQNEIYLFQKYASRPERSQWEREREKRKSFSQRKEHQSVAVCS